MRRGRKLLLGGLVFGFLLWPVVRSIGEFRSSLHLSQSRGCIIITDPSDIVSAGKYCLHEDTSAPDGISIRASDVSLDLGGFCLIGPRDPKRINHGIYIPSGYARVTITNGCVRGFFYGLLVDDASSPTPRTSDVSIRNLSFEQNAFRGATIAADNVDFRNNTITETGGATFFDDAYAIGLELSGDHCVIDSNFIGETYGHAAGEGVGISLSSENADHCSVTNNVISNRAASALGRTFGIWSDNASRATQNTVQGFDYAIVQQHSNWDRRANNVIIDEACRGLFYANVEQSIRDTQVSHASLRSCPDAKEAIDALKGVSLKIYLYRKGERLAMKEKWQKATAYFLAAERLGDAEAGRIARKHLALKLVSEADFRSAEQHALDLVH
jgi:hypothetical protein